MAKPYARAFYKSKEWKNCKESFLKSKHYLCERCGEPADIVHHKIYLTPENINDPKISLSFDNLEAICLRCHNAEHEVNKYLNKSKKRFKYDEYGRISPIKL